MKSLVELDRALDDAVPEFGVLERDRLAWLPVADEVAADQKVVDVAVAWRLADVDSCCVCSSGVISRCLLGGVYISKKWHG